MMAVVQVLVHYSTLVMGEALRSNAVPVQRSLAFTSPIYRLELTMVGRLFAQDPELYAAIEELNPHARDVVAKAAESIRYFADLVARGDFESFVADFQKTAEFLGDFTSEAQILSKQLIRHLP